MDQDIFLDRIRNSALLQWVPVLGQIKDVLPVAAAQDEVVGSSALRVAEIKDV